MFQHYLKTLMQSKGYSILTPVQSLSFNHIYDGKNVLVISPTGSGKTEAALWPTMIRCKEERMNIDGFKIIYVTPLRALNRDMLKRIQTYAETLGFSVGVRHGDSSESERRYQALHPPDILITTPETLQIILSGKIINKHLKGLQTLIIDEVHEILNDERGYQLLVAISRIKKYAEKFQIIGLSATIGNPQGLAEALFYPWNYQIVNAAADKEYKVTVAMNDNVDDNFADLIGAEKNYAGIIKKIYDLYQTGKQFIVFTNTRSTAEDIVMRLKLIDPKIAIEVHHGSLGKEIRTKVEEDFRLQKLRGLVCTSSMELGIDIGSIDHVLQVNSPRQAIRLVQRVGRGRHKLGEISEGTILAINEVEAEEGIAIAKLVKDKKIEPVRIREKPLIVLANQVMSILNASKEIELKDLFNTIKISYIFRNLEFNEFMDFIKFLSTIRMLYFDEITNKVKKTRKTMNYFFENISMIPDEKLYSVKESTTNKLIGFLDESFVATEVEIGSTFILRGDTWRVLNIKDNNIYVDYVQGISVPPSWIGEEIPVPFDVAKEVQNIRDLGSGREFTDELTMEKIEKIRNNLPKSNEILIEKEGNQTVIHVSLGTKGNYTLSILLSGYLSQKYGESFLVNNTPYSIFLQGNYRYSSEDVSYVLLNLEHLIDSLDEHLKRTKLFQYNFLNVAKKFGIISKDSDMTRIKVDKIISFYVETPLYREAIERFKWEYLDMDAIKYLLEKINDNQITFKFSSRLSEISKIYLENLKEKMMPIRPTAPILNAIKKRLLNEELGFYCLSCNRKFSRKVSEMNELRCVYCTSPRIAPIKKYELEEINELNPEIRSKLMNNFHLLRMHGIKALLVLAGHGIGTETANRILRIPIRNENELLEKILSSEVEFSKNKRFWS